MGLFSREPDPDTPKGAVAYFLKADLHPAVAYFRDDRAFLVGELERSWNGCSRDDRLSSLRGSYRFFLTVLQPDSTPFDEMPPEIQRIVALAGAKTQVMGFLWERLYGESMRDLAASWEPLSAEETDALSGEAEPRYVPGAFVLAAEQMGAAIRSAADELVQPVDKLVLSASLRAAARAAETLAEAGDEDDGDDAEEDGDDRVVRLHERLRQAEVNGDPVMLQRSVGAIAWYFVLIFIRPFREGLGEDGPAWAESMGYVLSPFPESKLDPEWLAETYRRRGETEAVRFYLEWAQGVLGALGATAYEASAEAFLASMMLPEACLSEMESWKTELRGAGILR